MIVNYLRHREVVRFIDGDRVTTHIVKGGGAAGLLKARNLEDASLPIGYIGHCRRELAAGREPLTVDGWRENLGRQS